MHSTVICTCAKYYINIIIVKRSTTQHSDGMYHLQDLHGRMKKEITIMYKTESSRLNTCLFSVKRVRAEGFIALLSILHERVVGSFSLVSVSWRTYILKS